MEAERTLGFRVVGGKDRERRLTDWSVAFAAHCADDERAGNSDEVFLSLFEFPQVDIERHYAQHGREAGYDGPCWSRWLCFDIDRANDLPAACAEAKRLAAYLAERYGLDDDELLIFTSGSKGFHVGIDARLWHPVPATLFHRQCRAMAEGLASAAGVTIDTGIYSKVRLFRAPNSRHPQTGRHKRRFVLDEFLALSLDAVLQLSEQPEGFELNSAGPAMVHPQAVADWQTACDTVTHQRSSHVAQQASGPRRLPRVVLDVIRFGSLEGDRHRSLFAAAAALTEHGTPEPVVFALLTDPGRDLGLKPSDVERQIRCGITHARQQGGAA